MMSVLERMEQMNCMRINGLNFVHVSRFSRLSLGQGSRNPVAREVRGNRCILMSSFPSCKHAVLLLSIMSQKDLWKMWINPSSKLLAALIHRAEDGIVCGGLE